MKRRERFLLSMLAALLLAGSPSVGQAAGKIYRVGVLAPEGMHAIESFKERLRQLGWKEGQNSGSIIARRGETTRANLRWRPSWWRSRST